MSEVIEIDGKILLPIKEVITKVSYTRDYVTRLARERKIEAVNVGRQWFVNIESLERYTKQAETEKNLRKQKLSMERKREKEIHESVLKQKIKHKNKIRTLHVRAVATACLVLGIGLIGGGFSYSFFVNNNVNKFSLGGMDLASIPAAYDDAKKDSLEPSKEISPSSTDYSQFSGEENGEVRQMGDVRNGIVLFPLGAKESELSELFSDEVTFEASSTEGVRFVVQVDPEGNPIGNRIPFVEISVNQENI